MRSAPWHSDQAEDPPSPLSRPPACRSDSPETLRTAGRAVSLSQWFLHGVTHLQPGWGTPGVCSWQSSQGLLLMWKPSCAWGQLGYSTGDSLSHDKRAVLGTSESPASSNTPSFTEVSQSAVLRRPGPSRGNVPRV